MNLSPNFTLAEATKSQTAERLGLHNQPSDEVIERMKLTAERVLEPVREHFGKPVFINSWYRSPAVNKAIGSSPKSQHVTGEAVDFEIPGISNATVAEWVRDNLVADQIILEFHTPGKPESGWVHVSYREDNCRQQCLTINAQGTFQGLLT